MEVVVQCVRIGFIDLDDGQEILAGHQDLIIAVDDAAKVNASRNVQRLMYDILLQVTSSVHLFRMGSGGTTNLPSEVFLEF